MKTCRLDMVVSRDEAGTLGFGVPWVDVKVWEEVVSEYTLFYICLYSLYQRLPSKHSISDLPNNVLSVTLAYQDNASSSPVHPA